MPFNVGLELFNVKKLQLMSINSKAIRWYLFQIQTNQTPVEIIIIPMKGSDVTELHLPENSWDG